MAKSYGFIAKIGGDTSGLEAALKDVDSFSRKINSELNAVNKQLKFDPQNAVLLAQKLELMGKSAEAAQNKLDMLVKEEQHMKEALANKAISPEQYREYERAVESARATVAAFADIQKRVAESGGDLNAAFNGVAESANEGEKNTAAWVDVLKGNLLSTAITKGLSTLGDIAKQTAEAFKEIAVNAAATGDTIDKQSQRLGLSQQAYQEWDYILSQNGTSISTLTSGVRKLTDKLDEAKSGSKEAAAAFTAIGLSVDELNKMTSEQQFTEIIKALQGIDDEAYRNARANDLLGRSYMDLIPLLNQSAESTDELRKRAHETNQLMSGEGVQAAVNYTDATDTLNRSLEGLKNRLGGDVLQALADIKNGFTDTVNGIDGGAEAIENGIDDLIDGIETAGTEFLDVLDTVVYAAGDKGPEIIQHIAQRIHDDAPKLTERANDLAAAVSKMITDSLPSIGTAAGSIAVNIGNGLIERLNDLPELITALGHAGENFCFAIADGIIGYDWGSFSLAFAANVEKALKDALDLLAPVHKQIQVWIDNLWTGGEVYGGNVNNVELWASDDFLQKYHDGAVEFAENLNDGWEIIRENYESGKEILGIATESFAKTTVDTIDAAADSIEESGETLVNTLVTTSNNTAKATDTAAKELEKAAKESFDELYKQLTNEEITREEFNTKFTELSQKWAAEQVDISKYTADKIADYDRKIAKQRLNEWEKEAKEITKSVQKAYEDVNKQYEKMRSKYIGEADLISQKLTDSTGKQRAILADFKKQTDELKQYQKDLQKLKDKGLSDDLIQQIMGMSEEDRKLYVSELANMSDKQRKKYYADMEEYYSTAAELAADDVAKDLAAADKLAAEGIDKIYADMPEDAYKKGVETAQAYIDGINQTMAQYGSLRGFTADAVMAANVGAAVQPTGSATARAAANSTGGTAYSGDTKIVINVAGKDIISTTLDDLIRHKSQSGGAYNF